MDALDKAIEQYVRRDERALLKMPVTVADMRRECARRAGKRVIHVLVDEEGRPPHLCPLREFVIYEHEDGRLELHISTSASPVPQ